MPNRLRTTITAAVLVLVTACQSPGITHLVPERYPSTTASKIVVIPDDKKPACPYKSIAEIAEGERQQQDRWLWPEELPTFTAKAASIGADALWIQAPRIRDLGQVRQGDSDNYVRTRMVTNYALALKWTGACK